MHAEPAAGDNELVHSIFKLCAEYPALEAEAGQLVLELETQVAGLTAYEAEMDSRVSKASQLVARCNQVKRLGLELRLAGEYKQLPEFATYTDLHVRLFSLRTKLDLLLTQSAPDQDPFDGV